MTTQQLPAPPTNTRWLAPAEIVAPTDYCLRAGLLLRVPLSAIGQPAGQPTTTPAGGWIAYCRSTVS